MLAPDGVLRAGINLSNFLLVTSRDEETGAPEGVSPDLAAELARRLDVGVEYVTYPNPGALGDALLADAAAWDIGQ